MIIKTAFVLANGAAVSAPLLPFDDWTKFGIAGVAMFINWWLVAKTIPAMNERHAEAWKEVASEIKDGNDKVVVLLREALIGRKP